jgi:hypothetical protein
MRLSDISRSYDEAEERRPFRTARMLAERGARPLLSTAKELERSALLSDRRNGPPWHDLACTTGARRHRAELVSALRAFTAASARSPTSAIGPRRGSPQRLCAAAAAGAWPI